LAVLPSVPSKIAQSREWSRFMKEPSSGDGLDGAVPDPAADRRVVALHRHPPRRRAGALAALHPR